MAKRKKLQELTIKDNFMFGAVMVNEDLCKELLEVILGFSIEKIAVDKEKSIIYHPEYKGVRLDIIAADENRTHYNIEMQVKRKKELGRRTRYYHSQIDVELLLSGMEYEELPDSYVIFICDFDPFKKEKYQYTFESVCKEDSTLSLGDGNHSIFLSTKGKNISDVSKELVCFLKYVESGYYENDVEVQYDFVKRLQEAVEGVKRDREMEGRYMLFEEMLKDEKAEGKAEDIMDLLSDLGKVPDELCEKIMEEKNFDTLRSYLKKAAVAKTIEEFESLIEE
ncbi:MAG: Rpn family recombination-promoting nuclease/putative transposase [Muricoprocola sp.]